MLFIFALFICSMSACIHSSHDCKQFGNSCVHLQLLGDRVSPSLKDSRANCDRGYPPKLNAESNRNLAKFIHQEMKISCESTRAVFWLGLMREMEDGNGWGDQTKWRWLDNSTLASTFGDGSEVPWKSGEPNNADNGLQDQSKRCVLAEWREHDEWTAEIRWITRRCSLSTDELEKLGNATGIVVCMTSNGSSTEPGQVLQTGPEEGEGGLPWQWVTGAVCACVTVIAALVGVGVVRAYRRKKKARSEAQQVARRSSYAEDGEEESSMSMFDDADKAKRRRKKGKMEKKGTMKMTQKGETGKLKIVNSKMEESQTKQKENNTSG